LLLMVLAVSFGAGTNSTAMVVGMLDCGQRPDWVLFADTGGERPQTYAFLRTFDAWLQARGLALTVVTNAGRGQGESLEANCLARRELPSLAYGFKGCSVKWKRQPMDRFLRAQPGCIAEWEAGGLVARAIGIDAGEAHRTKLPPDARYVYRYPLVDWGWDRAACVDAISRAGLPQPGKSSCFFCPAAKKSEVLALAKEAPDLFARAVAMEANSAAHTVKGLGRKWSWSSLVDADARQQRLFPELAQAPCDCMEGGDDD
jgi:hypothetical protein